MASKPKNVNLSKTARSSLVQKGVTDNFKVSGEVNRIVSLDNGNYIYLRSPVSDALYHLRIGSYAYYDRLSYLQGTEHWANLEKELIDNNLPIPE